MSLATAMRHWLRSSTGGSPTVLQKRSANAKRDIPAMSANCTIASFDVAKPVRRSRHRLVIAKLSSQHSPIDPGAVALTHRAVAEIRRCLTGQ
jgi:hypothetical protein